MAGDVAREIVNAFAGKVAAAVFPDEPFTLGIPRTGGYPKHIDRVQCFLFLTDDERQPAVVTRA